MSEGVYLSKEVIINELEDLAVLLDMQSGNFFGLNPVAKRMWELLSELGHAEEVVKRLLEEYDVGENQLRQDLETFIANLKLKGLAEVH